LSKGLRYDAAHERRRKLQLSLLYGRTREQVEEEQTLVQELHKIEARRRERERKKQDLQKLISQADAVIQNQDPGDWATGDAVFDTSIPMSLGSGGQTTGAGVGSGAVQRRRAAGGSVSSVSSAATFYAHPAGAESSASLSSLGPSGSIPVGGTTSAATSSATTSNTDLSVSLGSASNAVSSLLVSVVCSIVNYLLYPTVGD
uniref:DMAP1 domain-containing protein n=1 Tax=Echinostoma caproni TaxID=27848 RepID=A0A183BGL1_9TREM